MTLDLTPQAQRIAADFAERYGTTLAEAADHLRILLFGMAADMTIYGESVLYVPPDESHGMTIDELLPEIDRVLDDYRTR